MEKTEFARWIERQQAELGLGQVDIDRGARLAAGTVRNILRGQSRHPRIDTYIGIVDFVNAARAEKGLPPEMPENSVGAVNSNAQSHAAQADRMTMEDYARVPVFDLRVSAGPGAAAMDAPAVLHHLAFRRDWLSRITPTPEDQLCVVDVDGDSMEPTLHHGDHVLADTRQKEPKRDGIYVIYYDDHLMVKRLQYNPIERRVSIISDNPNYPTIPGLAPDEVQVLGRVVWLGRKV